MFEDEAGRLGALLRGYRRQALLTQEELAERSGVSVGTIAGLESGRTRRPRDGSVRLLADALALSGRQRAALAAAARGESPMPGGARSAGGPPVVPAQLPADLAAFTGRRDCLQQMDGLLPRVTRPGVVIGIVTGTAGAGKTTLAVHWAHRVAARFCDGQLYVNLRGFDPAGAPMDPAEATRGFLDALGVPPGRVPADPGARAGLYRSLLTGKQVLIVLDNARDADQVRPLLPGAPGCVVVVTSRNQLTGLVAKEGARPVPVDLLSPGEARCLLERRVGRDRVAAEPRAVEDITAMCARLPLALAIVAARAAVSPGFPLAAIADRLRDACGRLDVFSSEDLDVDVRAAFSCSYATLSPEAARLFRLLGRHAASGFAASTAACLLDVPLQRARAALAELTCAHLVSEHRPGRYALHDLLRVYAGERCAAEDSRTDREDVTARLHRWYDHVDTAVPATCPGLLARHVPGGWTRAPAARLPDRARRPAS